MSRRRTTNADFTYVGVRLMCPSGHPLGLVVKQRGRYLLTGDLVRVDAPDGRSKLKGTCRKCLKAGRTLDLQAGWDERVRLLLDRLEADPTVVGVSDLTIGGARGYSSGQ